MGQANESQSWVCLRRLMTPVLPPVWIINQWRTGLHSGEIPGHPPAGSGLAVSCGMGGLWSRETIVGSPPLHLRPGLTPCFLPGPPREAQYSARRRLLGGGDVRSRRGRLFWFWHQPFWLVAGPWLDGARVHRRRPGPPQLPPIRLLRDTG